MFALKPISFCWRSAWRCTGSVTCLGTGTGIGVAGFAATKKIRASELGLQCRSRFLHVSPPPTPPPSPPVPPLRGYTKLSNRSLISITGIDAPKFLQGIITQKVVDPGLGDHGDNVESNSEIEEQDQDHAMYTAFLNAKGRLIAESFIYPIHNMSSVSDILSKNDEPCYIVECDSTLVSTLMMLLRTYKLRSKVEFTSLNPEDYQQWFLWDDSQPDSLSNESLFKPFVPHLIASPDTRAPNFGLRFILPANESPADILSSSYSKDDLVHTPLSAYNIRRYLYGIPEGANELPPSRALPLESCIDYMGGIDFHKGCYVGQELTIRSYHHGVVRKRIIPVLLSDESQQFAPQSPPDLVYDPGSIVATTIDTYTCLVGSPIVNINPSAISRGFASSPFASSTSSTPESSSHRSSGTLIAAIGNIGLALVRIEHFADSNAKFVIQMPNALDNSKRNIIVTGFQPYWWAS